PTLWRAEQARPLLLLRRRRRRRCDKVPVPCRAAQDRRQVFAKQVSLIDQIQRRLADETEIGVLVAIPLFDRGPRITGTPALGGAARQRNVRTLHARQLGRRSGTSVEEIPSGIGGERNRELGHPDPGDTVAV